MTKFRTWMKKLCEPAGARPEWPLLLKWMLHDELQRARQANCAYTGKTILIPRVGHPYQAAVSPEPRAVYRLYHRTLHESSGLLKIGNETFWLLSYEVPNQHNEGGRSADLVALTPQGGLVVLECKTADGKEAPVAAMLEGLDYLACLLSPLNFARIQHELVELRDTLPSLPDCFNEVLPNQGARHGVIVLAPQAYFERYTRSRRGLGWNDFAEVGHAALDGFELRFAIAEIDDEGCFSRQVDWAHG